ncbi:MAG: CopD family protein [Granulosicoccaceae bacterium]
MIAINIWVGGSFFTVIVLYRAVGRLDSAHQHLLMAAVLRRFFFWIWIAMAALLASGAWMIASLFGGFANAPRYIILMAILGLLMTSVFLVMFFGPYRLYQQSRLTGDAAARRRLLVWIRRLSALNMVLGLCVVLVVGGGPHFLI